jgi:small subunit ribosomal protein S4e
MKSHLKRLTIPKTWPITKKSTVYVTRQRPSYSLEMSMPLSIVFRDVLKIADTAKEAKTLMLNNYVFVNGKPKKDLKQSMGFMDVLEVKGTKEIFRMLIDDKGKLMLVRIDEKEARLRPCRIMNKGLLKGGKTQLNLDNGYNVRFEKDEFKVGDTVVLQLPEKKILEKYPLEKDALVYIVAGSQVGKTGKVVDIDSKEITFKSGSETFVTSKEYAFVIGKDKPIIKLSD